MKHLLFLISFIAATACATPEAYQPRDGDIVFHTSRSRQSEAVQLVTRSSWSHMGIVYNYEGKALVFEAVQPVRSTPLDRWINRGEGGRVVVKRLKEVESLLTRTSHQPSTAAADAQHPAAFSRIGVLDGLRSTTPRPSCRIRNWALHLDGLATKIGEKYGLTSAALARMRAIGEAFVGRSYDLRLEWSDDRLYCSELVWKIYRRGLGIELGQPVAMADFDLSDPRLQGLIEKRFGGSLPADELVISPAAVFASDLLETVYRR